MFKQKMLAVLSVMATLTQFLPFAQAQSEQAQKEAIVAYFENIQEAYPTIVNQLQQEAKDATWLKSATVSAATVSGALSLLSSYQIQKNILERGMQGEKYLEALFKELLPRVFPDQLDLENLDKLNSLGTDYVEVRYGMYERPYLNLIEVRLNIPLNDLGSRRPENMLSVSRLYKIENESDIYKIHNTYDGRMVGSGDIVSQGSSGVFRAYDPYLNPHRPYLHNIPSAGSYKRFTTPALESAWSLADATEAMATKTKITAQLPLEKSLAFQGLMRRMELFLGRVDPTAAAKELPDWILALGKQSERWATQAKVIKAAGIVLIAGGVLYYFLSPDSQTDEVTALLVKLQYECADRNTGLVRPGCVDDQLDTYNYKNKKATLQTLYRLVKNQTHSLD